MSTRSFQMAKLASGSDRLTKLASGLDSGGSVTVSAIKADIAVSGSKATQTDLPTVGSRVGELSYIVDNDNMYVWGGDGWFKMQIVNATPRFLAPLTEASYVLDSPGNPTVIRLYGADSDGFAPTFIHTAADSAQYLARIVQDSNQQFTITPLSADSINAQAGYDSGGGAFNVAFKVTDGRSEQLRNSQFSISYISSGGVLFDTVGTHTWTVPAGVTSVHVVAVGAGGAPPGSYPYSFRKPGGGGGGLGWKNNIPVTPGEQITVEVGTHSGRGSSGGDSWFKNATTVKGGGGQGAGNYGSITTAPAGGTYVGDGGGNGGASYSRNDPYNQGGGGGAGGYSGNGGHGQHQDASPAWSAGSGGGGAGGAKGGYSNYPGGGGGGVGLYGEGASGSSVGAGGSGGADGGGGSSGGGTNGAGGTPPRGIGGKYGGGSGYITTGVNQWVGNVGQGGVRVIWGTGRAFPSTNVDQASSQETETTV